ncbi:MAG: hypothetical protein U0175_09295 [Caldilineaceae bacterium]
MKKEHADTVKYIHESRDHNHNKLIRDLFDQHLDFIDEESRVYYVQKAEQMLFEVKGFQGLKERIQQRSNLDSEEQTREIRRDIRLIAQWVADKEDFIWVKNAFDLSEDLSHRFIILGATAVRLVQTRNIIGLRQLADFVHEVNWRHWLGEAIGIVGWAMISISDNNDLLQTLSKLKEIDNSRELSYVMYIVIPTLAGKGHFDEAVTLATQYSSNMNGAFDGIIYHLSLAKSIDEVLPKIVHALKIAGRFHKEYVFNILSNVRYWFTVIDEGKTIWQVYKAVEEVENWWAFEPSLERLYERLVKVGQPEFSK